MNQTNAIDFILTETNRLGVKASSLVVLMAAPGVVYYAHNPASLHCN